MGVRRGKHKIGEGYREDGERGREWLGKTVGEGYWRCRESFGQA